MQDFLFYLLNYYMYIYIYIFFFFWGGAVFIYSHPYLADKISHLKIYASKTCVNESLTKKALATIFIHTCNYVVHCLFPPPPPLTFYTKTIHIFFQFVNTCMHDDGILTKHGRDQR